MGPERSEYSEYRIYQLLIELGQRMSVSSRTRTDQP